MTCCDYHKNKEWMRWYVTQDALLNHQCMDTLHRYYKTGPSAIKACTSRGPGGIQTSYGAIQHFHSSLNPEFCLNPFQQLDSKNLITSGLAETSAVSSELPAYAMRLKPPYRKITRYGVYVGNQPSVPIKRAIHRDGWNPDTVLPRECTFLHCKLIHIRKLHHPKNGQP